MVKQLVMRIKTKEKGFSIIEFLVVVLLLSSLSIVSLKNLNKITEKTKSYGLSDTFTHIQYRFIKLINETNYYVLSTYNDTYFLFTYPIISDKRVGDIDGDNSLDVMNYDIICYGYLDYVFASIPETKGGTYSYEPVTTFTTFISYANNVITYTCDAGTIYVTLYYIKNMGGSFEVAYLRKVEYVDNDGVSRSFTL